MKAIISLVLAFSLFAGCANPEPRTNSSTDDGSVPERPQTIEDPEALIDELHQRMRAQRDQPDLPTWPDEGGFSYLTEEVLNELKTGSSDGVVFIASLLCGSSNLLAPEVTSIAKEHSLESDVFVSVSGSDHPSGELFDQIIDDLVETLAFPTLVVFRKGRVVDIHVGVDTDLTSAVTYFFARNGFVEIEPEILYQLDDLPQDSVPMFVRSRRGLHGAQLDGVDFQGVSIVRGSFSGTSLRGANLEDVSLRNALLGHVDLTGARLRGADLTNAFFSNTICPDGTNSDDNGFTCEGHLE